MPIAPSSVLRENGPSVHRTYKTSLCWPRDGSLVLVGTEGRAEIGSAGLLELGFGLSCGWVPREGHQARSVGSLQATVLAILLGSGLALTPMRAHPGTQLGARPYR